MRDAFSDRKLLRRSSKFFFRLRKFLRLGSATLHGCGAPHIVVSRKLCYTMRSCTSGPFSFPFYGDRIRIQGSFWVFFCFFYFSCNAFFFFIERLFFIFHASAKQIASSCFSTFKNFKTADQVFYARHARRFARGRRQFVASSSFNPFPLDRLLGRPTPPWVPQTGFDLNTRGLPPPYFFLFFFIFFYKCLCQSCC